MYKYHKAENCRAKFWQSALCRIKRLFLKDLPEKAGISNQSTAVPKTCSTYPRVWIFSVWLRTAGEQDGETRFSPEQELLRLSPSALLFSGTAALLPASCQSRTGLRPGLVWVWWAWAQQACFGFPGDDGTAPWPPHWRVGILMTPAQTACPHVATQSWPCCPVEWARDTRGDAWPRRWATRWPSLLYSLCQSGSRWRTGVWSCRSARRQACSSGSARAAPWCPGTPGVPRPACPNGGGIGARHAGHESGRSAARGCSCKPNAPSGGAWSACGGAGSCRSRTCLHSPDAGPRSCPFPAGQAAGGSWWSSRWRKGCAGASSASVECSHGNKGNGPWWICRCRWGGASSQRSFEWPWRSERCTSMEVSGHCRSSCLAEASLKISSGSVRSKPAYLPLT